MSARGDKWRRAAAAGVSEMLLRSKVLSGRFFFVDEITGKPIPLAGKGERRTFLAKSGGRYRIRVL